MSRAVLAAIPKFGLAVNVNEALPVPLLTEGASQLWLEATVHAHPGSVTTLTSPLPPALGMLTYVGDTL